jgi:acyl-CoA thioesterase-2
VSATGETDRLPNAFSLQALGDGRFLASSIGDPEVHDVVFGGQILAQSILASDAAAGPDSGKDLSSIHTVFSRAATITKPLEIDVETVHDGRTAASHTVTVHQGDRICARALVFRQAPAPDLIRHHEDKPGIPGPGDCPPADARGLVAPGTEVRVADGVDASDSTAPPGPPQLFVWVKPPGASPQSESLSQALLAYATDGYLIGAAMRPHEGVGQDMAHRSLTTGVVTHTLSFHEPVPPGEWLLMAQQSTHAGRGRAFGRAQVFAVSGALVASFSQESIIRDGRRPDARL